MMDTRVDVYSPKKIKVKPYEHHVKYYETDQMRIVHHSNYIRWMEEARMDLMEQMGFGYDKMEELEIVSPVLSVSSDCSAQWYEAPPSPYPSSHRQPLA